jgi:hypothetical protein
VPLAFFLTNVSTLATTTTTTTTTTTGGASAASAVDAAKAGEAEAPSAPRHHHATTARARRIAPAGAHALSNSHLDDLSWSKVRFVRDSLAETVRGIPTLADARAALAGAGDAPASSTPEASAAALERAAEGFVAEAALRAIAPTLARRAPLPAEEVARGHGGDWRWSPLPPALEAHLQAHVFVPRDPARECVGW